MATAELPIVATLSDPGQPPGSTNKGASVHGKSTAIYVANRVLTWTVGEHTTDTVAVRRPMRVVSTSLALVLGADHLALRK